MKSTKTAGERSRVATEIVIAIERDILSGALAPGQRINEVAIAESFAVSRTPVREALLELAAGGMVEQRAHVGTFVADVTLEEIFDVYEVLAELEGLCARLATRRIDQAERKTLVSLHARMGRLLSAEQRDKYIALDYQFHGILIRAARNTALRDHLATCLKRIAPIRRTSMELVRDMKMAHAEHGDLVKAVIDGDAGRAEQIMCEHVALRAEQAKDLIARWKTRHTVAADDEPLPASKPMPKRVTRRAPERISA